MKILHTADWHIGRSLYGQRRYSEFEAFFSWLYQVLVNQKIDVLLVAGDVFDSATPSNRSQELYYSFLYRVANSPCRHVVITSGNHDSPSFLNAPKDVLRFLNVHVVGTPTQNIEDEVIVLKDAQGFAELIVCAVPYLKDRDIRVAKAGESLEEKDQKLILGLKDHYQRVCQRARKIQSLSEKSLPIVAMGHLFVAGGKTIEGDGVRELYIGSLARVALDVFPSCIDYLALGHLHVPQKVANQEHMRYSGSPIPMGFGESLQQKTVCIVQLTSSFFHVDLHPIPCFQRLVRLCGDWQEIHRVLEQLKKEKERIWMEIIYESELVKNDLRESLEQLIEGTEIKILRIKNKKIVEKLAMTAKSKETLDDLTVNDVFMRCLDAHAISKDERPGLMRTYQELLNSLLQVDKKA